ncbi:MAG: hypothetical protein HC836_43880 [Richelia sp. RM2_1_2]|nr:hypothetical protein [Richelia sp. RM2_1_2]
MAGISKAERDKLYLKVKHEMGFPIRPVQTTDEMMDSFLDSAIEDYSSYLNDWLIQQQWVSLQGLELGTADFLTAYSTKSNDFMRSFTFAYSRQVGLGTNAPAAAGWELKRDFIVTSADTQVYVIPANREVNELLWETPPGIDGGNNDPFALTNWTAGQMGWGYMGRPAMYVQPTYSTLLSAQDRRMKQRILQSTLTYRITGNEDGTKCIHLYPLPGGRNEIADRWGKHYQGRKVWYFYYDTAGKDRDKCLEENDDTIKLPSDAPTQILKYSNLNDVARQQVRDLFFAKCFMSEGRIRGFWTGEVGSGEFMKTMDYRFLFDQGDQLKEATKEKIFGTLEKLSLVQMTADRASIAENVNKERGYQPPRTPIISI